MLGNLGSRTILVYALTVEVEYFRFQRNQIVNIENLTESVCFIFFQSQNLRAELSYRVHFVYHRNGRKHFTCGVVISCQSVSAAQTDNIIGAVYKYH